MNPVLEAYLDLEQGTDPELLEARSRMPEPVASNCAYYRVRLAAPPITRYDAERCFATLTPWHNNDVQFERDEILAPGCSFWVWRAERDGKIYL